MIEFNWTRRGLLVSPGAGKANFSHASHACALHIKDEVFLIIYSVRNSSQRAHIFSQKMTAVDGVLTLIGQPSLSLGIGKTGTFDQDGLLACAPVRISDKMSYFYYSGWNNIRSDHGDIWLCDTGLASINHETHEFERLSDGPVMSRNRFNPYFAAATAVILENGVFKSWYNSGISWDDSLETEVKPKYGIHYAESKNGLDWVYQPGLVIPFSDNEEHSFGRPCVLANDDGYHMLFSCRGGGGNPIYRLGYAFSKNGQTWERNDAMAGLNPTGLEPDFDSGSIAYPFLFEHDGWRYLLYSGNHYGKTGTGYAVSEL
jgi:hypothetical protein